MPTPLANGSTSHSVARTGSATIENLGLTVAADSPENEASPVTGPLRSVSRSWWQLPFAWALLFGLLVAGGTYLARPHFPPWLTEKVNGWLREGTQPPVQDWTGDPRTPEPVSR